MGIATNPDTLDIITPAWAVPLFAPEVAPGIKPRILAAKGGRFGGKSHLLAEMVVEGFIDNPDLKVVCIREIQRTTKFSSKALIESKIKKLGLSYLFRVMDTEIRCKFGDGIIIFEGMQSHNAESIKSLEDFDIAWFEEARKASKRSLQILDPTIRKEGSQLWFSWNPELPEDPIEEYLVHNPPEDAIVVHCTYLDNPFLSDTARKTAENWRRRDPDAYEYIFLGGYNKKSDAQIFRGVWRVDDFEPQDDWNGPYQGLDFGFSTDPFAAVRCWTDADNRRLYIEREGYKHKLELDDTPKYCKRKIPGFEKYKTRADNARPDSISYLKRHGLPQVVACEKGKGSVEDGIAFIMSFEEVVIHSRCTHMEDEARLYCYKVDKLTGDILPDIVDANNHLWDSVRYALEPIMKKSGYSLGNVR